MGKGQCVTHPYLITHYPSLITNYIGVNRRLLVGIVFLR